MAGTSVDVEYPERTVVVPDLSAGCSLADGCPPDKFAAWKAKFPGAVVVTYNRKVMLEEDGGKKIDDPMVVAARKRLFGSWEMNWLAYNDAHDVKLPGSSGAPVAFLMYPQAESGGSRLDPLDPDNFKYSITARELKA